MARNKRPALTSPWKIGFLASLLPVAVGIGVGYFITRAFGFTWTWIEFHGTWSDYTFNRDAFMTEMLPLAVLVPVLSLLSYLLITSAVRRYRAYVDSGLDYKNFVKSIRQIDDIENEKQIKKLGNYPELRDFLLGARRTLVERREALDAREAALAEGQDAAAGNENLGPEADKLVDAVINAKNGGFDDELALETPELQRIEKAVRVLVAESATNDNASAAADEARWAELRDALASSSLSLGEKLAEIGEEISSSERSARDLEAELGELRHRLPDLLRAPAGAQGGGSEDAGRAIDRLDGIAQALAALGEETRTVAINTALQAGAGDGSGESVIQLADDVRDVAAKFNGIVQQWEEAGRLARTSFASAAPTPHADNSDEVTGAIDTIASRAGLWVERSVILCEKMKSFDQHWRDALAAFSSTLSNESASADDTDSDWSNLSTAAAPPTVSAAADDDEVFERQGDPSDLLIADAAEEAAEFERQEGIFKSASEEDDDAMFADIPGAPAPQAEVAAGLVPDTFERTARTRAEDAVEEPVEPPTPAAEELPDIPAPAPLVDDDITPGSSYPRPVQEAATDAEMPRLATSSHIEEIESIPSIDDAVDLYELGAVDYQPENAHHNA